MNYVAGHLLSCAPEDVALRQGDKVKTSICSLLIGLFCAASGIPAQVVEGSRSFKKLVDIKFAEVDGHELFLDLYLPEEAENPPLIVWVHGGAWRAGIWSRWSGRRMDILA